MSYTIIYKVPEQGEIVPVAEIHNSWRGAMHVWEALGKRYLPPSPLGPYLSGDMQPVWDLYKREDIPKEYRVTLLTTFDRVMVRRGDLAMVIHAFAQFAADFGAGSLIEQADVLRTLENGPTCYAVCWCQTSVSDHIWQSKARMTDDHLALWDIAQDTGHWFLFDETEAVQS